MTTSEGLDVHEVQNWMFVIWVVATFPLLVAALPIKAVEPVRKFVWPVLRRGKLLRSNETAGVGFQRFTVPQSFFKHFYVLGLFWNSLLLFTAVGFTATTSRPSAVDYSLLSLKKQISDPGRSGIFRSSFTADFGMYSKEGWKLVVLLTVLEAHLARRLYECMFVSSFDPSARMNILGYFFGLGFYVAVPLTLFVQSFQDEGFVHAFKGFLTQRLRGKPIHLEKSSDPWDIVFFVGQIGLLRIAGIAICLYGSFHQHVCHEILASLRPNEQPTSGKRYGIPVGDWFEYVSSPHYLAEIVIYAGIVIASGGTSLAMWILFMGVVANLYLVAGHTHEWYLSKFDNYPKTRRPLFPYIG